MGSVLIIYVYLRWPAIRSGSRAIITYLAIADFVTGIRLHHGFLELPAVHELRERYCNAGLVHDVLLVDPHTRDLPPYDRRQKPRTPGAAVGAPVSRDRLGLAYRRDLRHAGHGRAGIRPVASANWCFIGVIRDTTLRIAMIMVGGKFLEIITYVVALVLFVSTSIRLRIQKDFATHGLSCKRSAGRHYRHSAINDIIHRALVAAHVPSRLEPSGLYRSDGKRPDGITTVPWKCGQLLVWDATCPDTYAPSYSTIAAQQAGAVGQQAEDKKAQKYKHLSSHHFFTPVAIETSGVYGPRTADFLKEAGTSVEGKCLERRALSIILPKGCRLPFREAIQLQ
eukprot:Em0476g3a